MLKMFLLTLLFALSCATVAESRQITDMAGRTVTLPDTIRRVFTASPPATYMLYAVDPALLVGVNYTFREEEKRFLRPEIARIPVIGGFFGQGKSINMEVLLQHKPDVVVIWSTLGQKADELFVEKLNKAGIPTVFVNLDRLENYPDAFLFLGNLLDRKERARKLADYARETFKSVSKAVAAIPEKERLKIYYAEGPDGLATERETSWHAELIPLAGGRNVHKGEQQFESGGMEKISMEQVMIYDPEAIITHDRTFYDSLAKDRRWQSIRAVKNRRVYLIPGIPFNWFDRPPSFMRLLGLKWLANQLYPKRYPLDIQAETKQFYKLFLGVEPGNSDVREILSR
ncbi:MAG: ABC transporter substrate-binding protein [Desulfuromonadaceae bacterium]|nr:ABC transporter substrate-binding protein [Desulfuromonadaceae bacterium]